jgi:hypothetical protein
MALTHGGIDCIPLEPLRRTKSKGIGPNTVVLCGEKGGLAVDLDLGTLYIYLHRPTNRRTSQGCASAPSGSSCAGSIFTCKLKTIPCPDANASEIPNPRVGEFLFTTRHQNASIQHHTTTRRSPQLLWPPNPPQLVRYATRIPRSINAQHAPLHSTCNPCPRTHTRPKKTK